MTKLQKNKNLIKIKFLIEKKLKKFKMIFLKFQFYKD